jgi:hypothetical protein
MDTKSSGFWENNHSLNNSINLDTFDEATTTSSSPSQEHMQFASTPHVQLYLDNENEFLFADDLIDLADDLGIPNNTSFKIHEKVYTIFTNDHELYITGINELADDYYLGNKASNEHDMVYINCSEYSRVLKTIVTVFAKIKWQKLMLPSPNVDSESSCERTNYADAQTNLFRILCEHSRSITNEDLVKIISSKKWDILIWTDLNYQLLQKRMRPERITHFMQLLQKKAS